MEKVEEQYDSYGLYAMICALAVRKKMSLSEVERKLNFSSGLISTWKNSVPGIDKVIKVANFFNISIDELIGFKEKQHVESIAKIAKMVIIINNVGFPVELRGKDYMTSCCKEELTSQLMLFLIKKLNLDINSELKNIVDKIDQITYKGFCTKEECLKMLKDNIKLTSNDDIKSELDNSKKLIDFYDKL